MYGRHKCRCTPCKKAKADQHLRLYGSTAPIPATQVRKKVQELLARGFTKQEIARAAQISPATLNNVTTKRKYGVKVRPDTADLIMNLTYSKLMASRSSSKGTIVDAQPVRLQLQELHAVGWSIEALAEHTSVNIATMYRIMRGYNTNAQTMERMHALYTKVRYVKPPVSSDIDLARTRRAMKLAQENNWDGMMAEGSKPPADAGTAPLLGLAA